MVLLQNLLFTFKQISCTYKNTVEIRALIYTWMMWLLFTIVVSLYTVSDRTLACINYVLNQAEGVVRVGQLVYQFVW